MSSKKRVESLLQDIADLRITQARLQRSLEEVQQLLDVAKVPNQTKDGFGTVLQRVAFVLQRHLELATAHQARRAALVGPDGRPIA